MMYLEEPTSAITEREEKQASGRRSIKVITKKEKNMKRKIKLTMLLICTMLLVCIMISCGKSNGKGSNISVRLIENFSEYDISREAEDNEAVFFINGIPEEKILKKGRYSYILSTNEKYAAIVRYSSKKEKKVEFPEKIKGKPVVCITDCTTTTEGGWGGVISGQSYVRELTIPDSVVSIGNDAFFSLCNLKKVKLPDRLTHIGNGSFDFCESLKKVELPKSLISIGYGAFRGCKSLEEIVFPEGLEYISGGAFACCESLEDIDLPKTVRYVGDSAFSDGTQLKTVHLSKSTKLSDWAFNAVYEDTALPELLYYEEETDDSEEVQTENVETLYLENFEGYTLRIFDVGSVDDRYYSMFDQEGFDEVVKTVENLYNCKIVEVTSDDYLADFAAGKESGDSFCDIAIIPGDKLMDCIQKQAITPWQCPETVDLTEEWWDQSANDRFKIGDVQIALSGDFNMNNYGAMMCYAFNFDKLDEKVFREYDEYSTCLSYDASDNRFGQYGAFPVCFDDMQSYMYNGGICGSKMEYYRTRMAGYGADMYNVAEDGTITLSFNRGYDYLGSIDGLELEADAKEFRKNMNDDTLYYGVEDGELEFWTADELALPELKNKIRKHGESSINKSDYDQCDEMLFANGTSTFKIIRLDEFVALKETGLNLGIVCLPGGERTSLVDTPTLAVQPSGTKDSYKNSVLLNALAEFSSEITFPKYRTSVLGITDDYNVEMFDYICANPQYEFDIGSVGDDIEYLYYKYMLEYVSDTMWKKHKVSADIFDIPQLTELQAISAMMSNYLKSNINNAANSETEESVQTETWAEEYYARIAETEYTYVVDQVLDISKISNLCNGDRTAYERGELYLSDIIYAYGELTGQEVASVCHYNFEELYLQSQLSNKDIQAIEKLFYFPRYVVELPAATVQGILDYLYGKDKFDVHAFADGMKCHISEDGQSVYLQDSFVAERNQVFYNLADISYDNNEATISMNIVKWLHGDGEAMHLYDYATDEIVFRNYDGYYGYNSEGAFNGLSEMGVNLKNLSRVKLTLSKDADGVHIKDFRIAVPSDQ